MPSSASASAPGIPPGGREDDGARAARCAACGAGGLRLRFRVAGDPGPQGLIPSTDRYGTAPSEIVRCPRCGHMQAARPPAARALAQAYADAESSDYLNEEAGQRLTARRLLARLERHVQPGRLLDVGCWVGFLLCEARRRGWRPTGVEPSRFASAYARSQLGLDVRTAELFTCELEPRSFDAVVLADVLEHLPDPGAALARVAALARPGAALLVTVPDAGSLTARVLGRRWWSILPTHVHYFTRRSLHTLLTRHRWEVVEVGSAPKTFTVRYYLERIGGYSRTAADASARLAAALRLADHLWTPDFHDRMAVVARAPQTSGREL
jgi:SAM-dependent methyltransferase